MTEYTKTGKIIYAANSCTTPTYANSCDPRAGLASNCSPNIMAANNSSDPVIVPTNSFIVPIKTSYIIVRPQSTYVPESPLKQLPENLQDAIMRGWQSMDCDFILTALGAATL